MPRPRALYGHRCARADRFFAVLNLHVGDLQGETKCVSARLFGPIGPLQIGPEIVDIAGPTGPNRAQPILKMKGLTSPTHGWVHRPAPSGQKSNTQAFTHILFDSCFCPSVAAPLVASSPSAMVKILHGKLQPSSEVTQGQEFVDAVWNI